MIAQLQVAAILFMLVIVPMQWLSANTYLLVHHQWGEKNMTKAINLMYYAFIKVRANGALILDEYFKTNIFPPIILKLPELKDFFDWYYKEKRPLFMDHSPVTAIKFALTS